MPGKSRVVEEVTLGKKPLNRDGGGEEPARPRKSGPPGSALEHQALDWTAVKC